MFLIPWILKFDEGERWALTVVKVYVENFAVLVENVLEVSRSYVRRQVTHVHLIVIVSVRSSRHRFSSFSVSISSVFFDTTSSPAPFFAKHDVIAHAQSVKFHGRRALNFLGGNDTKKFNN